MQLVITIDQRLQSICDGTADWYRNSLGNFNLLH